MQDRKRLYTKYTAECTARLYQYLYGVVDVVIYGDIVRGYNGERVQLLLVVRDEKVFKNFVKHLKQQRKTHQNAMSENMRKQNAGKIIWNEAWPSRQMCEGCVEKIEHVDVTVVPYKWRSCLDEMTEIGIDVRGLPRYAYPVV